VLCIDNFDTFYDPAMKRANLSRAASNPNFRLIEADIRDQATITAICKGHDVDRIFHAAARAGVRPSVQDPFLYEDVNVRGTMVMLEAARHLPLKTFVFASSSSVYGGLQKVPFTETFLLNQPISPYAATKLAAEQICYTYHHLYGIPITCLRFFTVYGPRQRPEMAIHHFARLIEEGKPIPVYGDGGARRDFTFIEDIVQGVTTALDRAFPFEIFNLGESDTIELSEVIRLLEACLGKQVHIDYFPVQAGDMLITYADITKARRMLDYRPGTPIKEGLERFVQWFRTRQRGEG
jgi:UDP-glucuronate 4-epimerase